MDSSKPLAKFSTGKPKGFFPVCIILVAEFFSYYGMRGLLVLFFTSYLAMSDKSAYNLYADYTALIWVTPIIGGYLADKYLGYYFSVVVGSLLIFLGNVFLAFSGHDMNILYFAMAIVICGYGFFKGNVSCLAGTLYAEHNETEREKDFSWYYISGNIGATLALIVCGWAYTYYGHHAGFLLSSVVLFVGIILFMKNGKHLKRLSPINHKKLHEKSFILPNSFWIFVGFVCLVLLLVGLIASNKALYLLLLIGLISLICMITLFIKANLGEVKSLVMICCFMIFGFVFWVFDQQNGSSLVLFVDRYVNRHILGIVIPTSWFQSINSLSVIFGGFLVSWFWNFLKKANVEIPSLFKLSLGVVLLTAGFLLITLSAKIAYVSQTHYASALWIVIGMTLIGIGELFVDPVVIANITRLNPVNSRGLLVGIYLLFTGSFANYIAGKVAIFTDITNVSRGAEGVAVYLNVFKGISYSGIVITVVLLLMGFYFHRFFQTEKNC